MCRHLVVIFCLLIVIAAECRVSGALPIFGDPTIYARSGVSSFNLPNGSSFGSPTLSINDARDLAIDVNFVGNTGEPGVFFGAYNSGTPSGGIVVGTTDTIAGDPQLNNLGEAIYAVGFDDNPFVYDSATSTNSAINYPLGVSGSSNLVLTDIQIVGARVDFGFSGDAHGTFARQSAGLPAFTLYVADNGVDSSSPYSFLYTPDTSHRGGPIGGPAGTPRIASKVSTTAGFDFEEIHIFDADGTSRLVAVETEVDPMSQFSEFVTNSVAISNNGRMVAFQANDLTGTPGIYRYDDSSGMIDLIAQADGLAVNTIDIFGPDVNDQGLVVFRGDDSSGSSAVFIGNGNLVTRVAGEGDVVMTDLGPRELGRRDLDFSQSGAPRINNKGDVAFIFQYFDPTNAGSVADGSLALLRPAFRSGDYGGDGVFECIEIDSLINAIASGNHDPNLDLNQDGTLDLVDRDIWLAQAGAAQSASGAPLPLGDANLDGTVEGADFLIWNANKFTATGAWCSADFNADGMTDGGDFLIWNTNKFTTPDMAPVPEPSFSGPFILLAMWVVTRDRRPRSMPAG